MFVQLDDVRLHVRREGQGAPLLLLHGFTGSAAQWGPILPALARHWDVWAVDLIGHGASEAPRDVTRYDFTRCRDDLAHLLDLSRIERAHWLGYSMGGRVALGFALAHPDRVHRLVLESASPGIADEGGRRARASQDAALAERIERVGVPRFVDEWMAQPLFASQRRVDPVRLAEARRLRLQNRAHALANSLRGMGAGAQPSYWEHLHRLTVPSLLVAGERDQKFRAIAGAMAARMPRARVAMVSGAGHATHFEAPQRFVDCVAAFLSAADDARPAAANDQARGRTATD